MKLKVNSISSQSVIETFGSTVWLPAELLLLLTITSRIISILRSQCNDSKDSNCIIYKVFDFKKKINEIDDNIKILVGICTLLLWNLINESNNKLNLCLIEK